MKPSIALVTGGTGGIGSAICRQLHQQNVKVVAGFSHGGDNAMALQWQAQQKHEGYSFEIVYADVKNFEACGAMIDQIETHIGPIDILINNAGITRDGTLRKMTVEQWNDVLRTNLDSVFNVTRQVINGMVDRGFGRIINVSSVNGQKGQFGQTNYCASKSGVHGFTKALAQEVANKGVTVNTISPGYVETEMVKKLSKDMLDKIIAQIPVGRLAQPQEIARLVGFLVAKDSGFITGANIAINGGQHMY